jgi:glutamate/tyrosine decarboxylase-like PLP-dependent enzyme
MPVSAAHTLSPEEFRRNAHAAVDALADWLAGLPARPVYAPMTPTERALLHDAPLPDAPRALDALVRDTFAHVHAHPMGNGHPRFFGWVNPPPALPGVLADLLAAGLNPSVAGGDHAAVYVERAAVRWLMELLGFPTAGSMGILTSGGSMASLTGLAAARLHACRQAGRDVRADGLASGSELVVYASSEVHSCVRKTVELLGLGARSLRVLPADAQHRLVPTLVAAAISADRRAGRVPCAIAASAGTVASGAVDPFDELADLAAAERVWLHVDGAYGAFGRLDPAAAPLFRGLERADSIAVDPHKWLGVPAECGAALVRDGELLRATFSFVPAYLQTQPGRGFGGLPWYSEYGFQQTRGFRALKLWFVLQSAGRSGLVELVARHNALARALATRVRACAELELLAEPTLSIVCFRHVPPRLRGAEPALAAHNRALMERLQSEGRAFVTNAELDGRFALRACILHPQTSESDLDLLVDETLRCAGFVQQHNPRA